MGDHDCRRVEVTRLAPKSLRVTSTHLHFALTRRALVVVDSRAAFSMSAATAAGCET
jgi:hypothetical protein